MQPDQSQDGKVGGVGRTAVNLLRLSTLLLLHQQRSPPFIRYLQKSVTLPVEAFIMTISRRRPHRRDTNERGIELNPHAEGQ